LDWEQWALGNGLLEHQVWESTREKAVFCIDKLGGVYRVVMFAVEDDGSLRYVQVAMYQEEERLLAFLDKMGMAPTSKVLSLNRN